MVATLLRNTARILLALGILSIVLAIAEPITHSSFMFIGLALGVGAFLCSLWRQFAKRAPIQARGGGTVTFESSPFGYLLWFAIATAFGVFFIYVLLHNQFEHTS